MKMYLIIFAIIGLLGTVGTFAYKYNKLVEHNTQLTVANLQYEANEKIMKGIIEDNDKTFKAQQVAQAAANMAQAALQAKFVKLSEDIKSEQSVFTKKEGRYKKLLQEKGAAIIKLSNAAAERVRNEWRIETQSIADRLQVGARSLYASP